MSYEPKDGSGALFKNDKGDNPARPDYRGDITINGKTYEISAWIKPLRSDETKRFMSLSAKPKQARTQGGSSASDQPPPPPPRQSRRDDDLPPF
jgi:hypothetical protein